MLKKRSKEQNANTSLLSIFSSDLKSKKIYKTTTHTHAKIDLRLLNKTSKFSINVAARAAQCQMYRRP